MLEEHELVSYLPRRFATEAIVLVGSRASAYATPHSDWDVKVFAAGEPQQRRKLQLRGAFVDLEVFPVPLPDGFALRHPLAGPHRAMRILHDRTGVAAVLAANTLAAYEAGPPELDDINYRNRQIYLAKAILKLSDLVDDPLLSFGYVSRIFAASLLYWFALRAEWAPADAEALIELKERDPEYFAQVSILASGAPTLREAPRRLGHLSRPVPGRARTRAEARCAAARSVGLRGG